MRFMFLFLLLSGGLMAQRSTVTDTTFYSNLLHRAQHVSVYKPAGYVTGKDSLPVLYLLHGMGDNHTGWLRLGRLQQVADSCISNGSMKPCIIVMPDAGLTYYLNSKDGNTPYEDYFMHELIPALEKRYACKTGKQNRVISGLSMGGFGCLLYAMHHPDMFSACYAMSPGIRNDEDIKRMSLVEFKRRYSTALGTIHEKDERITPWWHENSILYLAEHMPEVQKKQVRYYIDCGDDDPLSKGSALLHIIMQQQQIPHEYRVKNGAHTWEYWQEALPTALKFLTADFR
ncbi:enterochelin esterase-like enzyme [Filimonas zeae]|nr:alpha/beta hydrolase family protein [Filimonas zeae]MDR6339791.1 enterochelin esterase-like enzyme [Filimonas zeae]